MGKSVGQDQAKEKWTYPRLIGLERAKKEAHVLVEESLGELNGFGPEADPLRGLALYMIERKK